ncbi:DUF2235 domain-containing protein [Rubellimicrobium roseum]|uniref:DUF2235 domain-containing protein n=1 Tax=Rubellimicrobium roseum TaxID=687525 RepID=A0A5C4N595_9RHOB|nr:DUF2235 domain-containing protein [Rubellimicrobium roseum]TNC64220.1 DUF2235 domain-containing protein [Rubellimicrobium roseum]
MKRIAIFCDGTWNTATDPYPTNVSLLRQALDATDAQGQPQTDIYQPGVGAQENLTGLRRLADRWAGGVTGRGLDTNIMEAYRDLAMIYEPGDAIHVFGFSRGAYTARSLVGLIRSAGVPPVDHIHRIPEAMTRYRIRGDLCTRPSNPASYPFRAEFAPFTATGAEELTWRRRHGKGSADAIKLRIAYLGIWDTVGALGVPGYWTTAPIFNERYQFHDAELSSMVRAARHAVAVDERRQAFEPTLWTNVDELNRQALNLPPEALLADICREELPYRQEWFPGDHGAVGGGERRGLSAYPRAWVAEGAWKSGLAFKSDAVEGWRRERNVMEPLVHVAPLLSASAALRVRSEPRKGPCSPLEVAPAVFDRIRSDVGYRPPTLNRIWDDLRRRDRIGDVCGVCIDAAACDVTRIRSFA